MPAWLPCGWPGRPAPSAGLSTGSVGWAPSVALRGPTHSLTNQGKEREAYLPCVPSVGDLGLLRLSPSDRCRRLWCTESNICPHRWRKEMLDVRVPNGPPTDWLLSLRTQNSPDVIGHVCTPWQCGMYRVTRGGFPKARTGGVLFVNCSWCFTLQVSQKCTPSVGPRAVQRWAPLVAIIYSCCSLSGCTYFLQPDLAATTGTWAQGTWWTWWARVCGAEEIGAAVKWAHAGAAHPQIHWPL